MRGVRERERQRTTPLLKGLTWRKKAATHSHTCVPPRTQTPIKLPTTYGTDERLAYRRGQTNTAHTHTYAHSCSKNKDKSMFDAPNPESEERREWEDGKRGRGMRKRKREG